jgi:exonuclease SbcD
MRVLHTSDWHLGHQLHGVSREREHAAFLAWLLEVCVEERVDAILHTGDVFDGANPPASAQAAYYGFLADVAARLPDVQIVVLGGNHDSPARLDAPAPLLERLRVRVIGAVPRGQRPDGEIAPIEWDRAIVSLGDVTVLAIPFLRVADLHGDDVGAAIRAIYAEGLGHARARAGGAPLIVTGHLHVTGSEPSILSERRILSGGAEAIGVDLFPPDVAYVALGHLHKAQRVGGRDNVRYAGSPIPLAMGEAHYQHQIAIVDLDAAGAATVRTRVIPRTVPMLRIKGTLDDVLNEIMALPTLGFDDDHDLRPYLEVQVRLDKPAPNLRARLDHAIDGKVPRLIAIKVERAGAGAALGDATPGVSLADLSPRDVLVQRWRRDHTGDPPAALLAAFDELLARVQQDGVA